MSGTHDKFIIFIIMKQIFETVSLNQRRLTSKVSYLAEASNAAEVKRVGSDPGRQVRA